MKSLAEELDPKVHQFWPIDLERGPEGVFWGMNIHAHQATIIDEFSDIRQLGESGIMKFKGGWKTITLDQSKLSTLNMWREDRYPGPLFVSDAFQQELKARKLKFFKLAKTV